ncbi:hypothetical protein [Syntrophomonas palmitatica]|uniref:hypothetical protein n=1 Tax=Syntrophomonas palmitatica TaxID=402877 RepID=UPI0006D070A8|nr:hypothetical protein [Syntrophomonas palmitatica]
MSSIHMINKQNHKETTMPNDIKIKCIGGNAQKEVNAILAKIVLSKLAEKEGKNESSHIYKA